MFASERVEYYGQPIGLLVADNRGAAYAGKFAVKVTYDDFQPPVLTIEEALTKPLPPSQFPPVVIGDVSGEVSHTLSFRTGFPESYQHNYVHETLRQKKTKRNMEIHFPLIIPLLHFCIAGFGASTHVIEGAMTRGGQFHFHMETQVSNTRKCIHRITYQTVLYSKKWFIVM